MTLHLTGAALTLEDVVNVAQGHERDVRLAPSAQQAVQKSRDFVKATVAALKRHPSLNAVCATPRRITFYF